MRTCLATLLLLTALGGCSLFGESKRNYSVFFQPYSSELDDEARVTVRDATSFAQIHRLQPVALAGFSAPPDPAKDVDGLSAQRAEAVKQALISGGVNPGRITVAANGITDPDGKPNLSVRRVDIRIGQ